MSTARKKPAKRPAKKAAPKVEHLQADNVLAEEAIGWLVNNGYKQAVDLAVSQVSREKWRAIAIAKEGLDG